MDLKQAILGYITVLGVEEYQGKLSLKENEIGRKNILGCLFAIEDRLTEKGDQDSLSLLDIIKKRETVNGQIYNIQDPRLVVITKECAQRTYDYYAKMH